MKVQELIDHLKLLPPDLEIKIASTCDYVYFDTPEITNTEIKDGIVHLCTGCY